MEMLIFSIPHVVHLAAFVVQPSLILQLDPFLINERRVVHADILEAPVRVVPYMLLFVAAFGLSSVLFTPFAFLIMGRSLSDDIIGSLRHCSFIRNFLSM